MSLLNSAFNGLRRTAMALAWASAAFSTAATAQTFGGIGGGGISDNSITGTAVTFNVNGLAGRVRTVEVTVNLQHTFAGDLTVQLVSPNGLARLNLFGRIGTNVASNTGYGSNLSGSYAFSDSASNDLWATAAVLPGASAIPNASAFRTSVAGVPGRGRSGGCSSFLSLAFGGLSATQANGTWVLRVTDTAAGDTGTVSGVGSTLSMTMEDPPLFADRFEDESPMPVPVGASSTVGKCTPAISSPTGSGVSDYVLTRPQGNMWRWIVKVNTAAGDGPLLTPVDFGGINDDPMMGDFDGDGLSDFTVSRTTGGAGARFIVRRSSRPNDLSLDVSFGTGPVTRTRFLKDYDGDNITDFTAYTAGPLEGDTTGKLQVRLSSTGETRTYLVPFASDLPVSSMRDFNGDGRADIVRRTRLSVHRVFSGADGELLDTFTFGQSEDSFFAAQVTGSEVSDFTVYRTQLNPQTNIMQTVFQTRDSATGATTPEFYFPGQAVGISAVPGDFDGDALVDYAIWRPSGLAGDSRFVVRPSTMPNTLMNVFIGDGTEYAVASWDINGYPD